MYGFLYLQQLITPSTIQQITARVDIMDVVGEFVRLKKRGANYLGLCPFHNEKTPSFTVSPSKDIYKCFGCGKSGNSISFLMEHEKYTFVEALKWLGARYNIEIEETVQSEEGKLKQQAADSLFVINTFAQKFFSAKLHEEEGSNEALSYLEQRGFKEEVLTKFQVGYNPKAGREFASTAINNQFNPGLLLQSGLVTERNEALFDNYRGRILFPVHNITGKIIGFGARIIGKAEKSPKYINTPENDIYHKSKILYGSYFARSAISKQNECLLVEGYTDVISLHQAGIENVVASGGTSLTADQLRLVKKYTSNLTIIYDGDEAGIKAALRGLDMALEESLNVKLLLIPDKEDPDSYVNKIGADEFRRFISENKKDFILFQLEVMLKDAGNDVSKKNEVVKHIAETLSRINKTEDFTKQQEYIKQCANILNLEEEGLTTLVNQYKKEKINKEEKKLALPVIEEGVTHEEELPGSKWIIQQDILLEENLVRLLLENGLNKWNEEQTIADYIFEELENFRFDNQQTEKLYELYKTQYDDGLQPTVKTLLYHNDENIRKQVINITMFPFELSQRWDEKLENMNILAPHDILNEIVKSLNYFKLRKIKKMFLQNQKDMESSKDMAEQLQLLEIHKQLKAIEIELTRNLGTVIIR